MRRSFVSVCILLTAASLAWAQDAGTRVNQIFEDLDICSVSEIWDLASELEQIGAPAVVHLKRGLINPSAHVRLASSKTLLGMGEERDLALKALVALLRPDEVIAEDPEDENALRLLACELIFIHAKKRAEVRPLAGYIDLIHDAYVKISMAKVLRKRGRDSDAVAILKAYLESDDFSVSASAALALAEVGNVEAAKPVLEKLGREPTERGELARQYLERDRLLSSIDSTAMLAKDPQIAALREQVAALEADIKKLKAENRMAANNEGGAAGGDYPLLDEILSKIDLYYVTDDGDMLEKQRLLDAALKGMVAALDPFSSYMTGDEWKSFIEGMSQEYAGIGAYVNKDPQDGFLTISRPFYKGPAFRAGLRSLDKIVEVTGVSTHNLDIQEIISKLKGAPGSKVKIKVFRRGWDGPREFEIERENIEVKSVYHEMLPGSVGFLSLSQFGQDASEEMARALDDLVSQGMVALILDLRNNGGGYLNQARDIADLFLPADKVVCFSKGRNQVIAPYTEHKTSKPARGGYPIVVLVNGASASASEIVSGCLKDHGRALLVGNKTFGKGSVQQLLPLNASDGRLRLTIARYYLPSGISIHEVGVEPDVLVELADRPVWKNEAMAAIQVAVDDYVFQHFAENKATFHALAAFDGYDPSRYPGFDEFFGSLSTELSAEDVRELVRAEVRRLCQDDLSRFFPTDLQQDEQLQRAIYEIFERNELEWTSIDEYARFIETLQQELQSQE